MFCGEKYDAEGECLTVLSLESPLCLPRRSCAVDNAALREAPKSYLPPRPRATFGGDPCGESLLLTARDRNLIDDGRSSSIRSFADMAVWKGDESNCETMLSSIDGVRPRANVAVWEAEGECRLRGIAFKGRAPNVDCGTCLESDGVFLIKSI